MGPTGEASGASRTRGWQKVSVVSVSVGRWGAIKRVAITGSGGSDCPTAPWAVPSPVILNTCDQRRDRGRPAGRRHHAPAGAERNPELSGQKRRHHLAGITDYAKLLADFIRKVKDEDGITFAASGVLNEPHDTHPLSSFFNLGRTAYC